MAKVLKLMQCTNLGGMEKSAHTLLHALKTRGHKLQVATPRPLGPGEQTLRAVDPDLQAFPYKGRFGWKTFKPFKEHVQALGKDATDIWLTGTDLCSLRAILPLEQRKLLGHHFHHFEGRRSRIKWWGFYNGLCRQLDGITYPTDFTRNEALHIAPWLKDRSHVVRYVFDPIYTNERERLERRQEARRKLNLPAEAWIVGNAGWLIQRKRFDIFLQTARAVADSIGSRAYFVICGTGPLEQRLKRQVERLGLTDQVLFAGLQHDIDTWYDSFDVLLFNSDFDTMPLTPCEAMARGCLLVASLNYGGLSEFVKNGANGFLHATHDVKAMAGEIEDLSLNPARAAHMRARATADIRQMFSLEEAVSFYEGFWGDT